MCSFCVSKGHTILRCNRFGCQSIEVQSLVWPKLGIEVFLRSGRDMAAYLPGKLAMKRQPLILAIALPLVLGAALWGANWRLDNPPLTKADKDFRTAVAGAGAVRLDQKDLLRSVAGQTPLSVDMTLDAEQTRELISILRFSRVFQIFSPRPITMRLFFLRQNQKDVVFSLEERVDSMQLTGRAVLAPAYGLSPRSAKRVRRFLDEVAPKRLQAR